MLSGRPQPSALAEADHSSQLLIITSLGGVAKGGLPYTPGLLLPIRRRRLKDLQVLALHQASSLAAGGSAVS